MRGQFVHDFFVSLFCAAGDRVLIVGCHADSVSHFKEVLLYVIELVKSGSHHIATDAVSEDVRIVPTVITGNVLARFFAVLVLRGVIEWSTVTVLSRKRQIFGCCFFGAVLFSGILGNDWRFCQNCYSHAMPRVALYSPRDLNEPGSSLWRQSRSALPTKRWT